MFLPLRTGSTSLNMFCNSMYPLYNLSLEPRMKTHPWSPPWPPYISTRQTVTLYIQYMVPQWTPPTRSWVRSWVWPPPLPINLRPTCVLSGGQGTVICFKVFQKPEKLLQSKRVCFQTSSNRVWVCAVLHVSCNKDKLSLPVTLSHHIFSLLSCQCLNSLALGRAATPTLDFPAFSFKTKPQKQCCI